MDLSRFRQTADRASVAYGAVFVLTALTAALLAPSIVYSERSIIGGDFLAFYTAGEFALAGDAATAYDKDAFDAALKERAPLPLLGMSWQYPPTVFFLAAPFALLPYKAAFVLWALAGWGALAFALRRIGFDGARWRIMIFSPLCVAFVSHGQINCLTAALLFLAAYEPKTRWLVAGAAAGLLTIKPQLGLLIPVAYAAAGAWRAVAAAGATAATVHLTALAAFGFDAQRAFFRAVAGFGSEIVGPALSTPPVGMTTLFGQLKRLGVAGETALMAQYALSAALAAAVFWIWRRSSGALTRAAFLSAAAILAAPYAYGYELTALLLAGAWMAHQAKTPHSALGAYLLAMWALIAAGPFLGNPPYLNTPFAIAVSALVIMGVVMTRRRANIELRAAPAQRGSLFALKQTRRRHGVRSAIKRSIPRRRTHRQISGARRRRLAARSRAPD